MSNERATGRGARRPALLWFRDDLRLADNAALQAAAASGRPVIACFVLDERAAPAAGAASRWWLHESLTALAGDVAERGGTLVLRRGSPALELVRLVAETGAEELHCAKSYEPAGRRIERDLRAALAQRGMNLGLHAGGVLFDPELVRTQSGEPFRVFTPFWNACLRAAPVAALAPEPRELRFARASATDALDEWALRPRAPDWAGGLRASWTPGERSARARLDTFVGETLERYRERRDRPDLSGTSRLSPYLHFGELSVRTVWSAVQRLARGAASDGGAAFLRELGWREFARHLLWHWPEFATESFRPEFRRFPWRDDPEAVRRWQRGRTGYPIVDAGMRELWHTGWMHNRVRMVAASFLVKHLGIPWRTGAAWFWDTLVDADLANNSVGWQWVAGSGADAAPYFRIFNPSLQGRKFDPNGAYIRQWIPELARVPEDAIHEPPQAQRDASSGPGSTYPSPMVVHRDARARALASYEAMNRRRRS